MADEKPAEAPGVLDPARATAYRDLLELTVQKSQEGYDKTLIALSGGALGLSLTFITDFVAPGAAVGGDWLIGAWAAWVGSLTLLLGSFYTGIRANFHAIQCVDKRWPVEVDRGWDLATGWLNALGGIAFVAGAVLMIVFLAKNIDHTEGTQVPDKNSPGPGKIEKGYKVPAPPPVVSPGRPTSSPTPPKDPPKAPPKAPPPNPPK